MGGGDTQAWSSFGMATLETQRVGDLFWGNATREDVAFSPVFTLEVQDIRGWAESIYISVLPRGLWVQLVEDSGGGWGWGGDGTSVHPRKSV